MPKGVEGSGFVQCLGLLWAKFFRIWEALAWKISALQRYYGNSEKTIHLPLPFPVSLNRSGIPRCFPSFHRKMISRRDETADQLVCFFLSMFSLSKWILVRKKGRFGYDSIVKRPSSSLKIYLTISYRYV